VKGRRARELLDSLQDLVYLTDADSRIMYANRAFAACFGYEDSGEMLGAHIGDVYAVPEHRQLHEAVLRERHGRGTDFIIVAKGKTGETVYLSVDSAFESDADGKGRYSGTCRDVTERQRVLGPFFQCTGDGLITFGNSAFAELLGFGAEIEVIGHQLQTLFVATEKWEEMRAELASNDHESWEGEIQLQGADRGVVNCELRARAIGVDNSQLIGIEGSLRDVTGLRALERRFAGLLERSMDGIYVLQEGRIRVASPGLVKILGYSRSEVVGSDFSSFVHEDDREAAQRGIVDEPGGASGGLLEIRVARKDGQVIPVRCSATSGIDDGKPVVLGYLRDITEEKAREQELEQAVEQRTREKELFLELLIHEIAAPIVGIRGLAELILSPSTQSGVSGASSRRIASIRDLADLTLMLVQGVEAAQEEREVLVRTSAVSLGRDVIHQSIEIVAPIARNRGFDPGRIKYVESDQIPTLLLDVQLMRQVFFNLLSNSIKFAREEPENFRVVVRARRTDRCVEITVQDSGLGIPEPDAARAFERGTRASNVLLMPGKGLGLFVVRRLLDAMHSRIEITSLENPTEFTVMIPERLVAPSGGVDDSVHR